MIEEIEEIIRRIEAKEIAGADETAIVSARALAILAQRSDAKDGAKFRKEIEEISRLLINARPSSASLRNCILHIKREVKAASEINLVDLRSLVEASASNFVEKINKAKSIIGEIGSKRIKNGKVILTHGFSTTVYAILKRVAEERKRIHVFVTEARPGLEGRQMAKMVGELGLPVTLITDSAVRLFLNEIDNVLTGAEAVAVNGAVISKVGTAVIAALAHEVRVRVLAAAGTYKLSPETVVGELVEIEEGDQTQVIDLDLLTKMKNVEVRNPLYDVTSPEYIDAIITERGIIPPQAAYLILRQMMEG